MRNSVVSMVLVLSGALFACTESHDVIAAGSKLKATGSGAAGTDAAGSGSVAGTGGAGSGINTGMAGKGAGGTGGAGTGAGGTGAAGADVGTGCNNCMDANVGGVITLTGCCAMASGGGMKCGLDLSSIGMGAGCIERDGPGTADTSCPSSNQQQVITLPGCCRPNGKCGSLDTNFGLGCTPQADGVDRNCGAGAQ